MQGASPDTAQWKSTCRHQQLHQRVTPVRLVLFAGPWASRLSEVAGLGRALLPFSLSCLLCRNKQRPKITAQQKQGGVRQQGTRGTCTNLSPVQTWAVPHVKLKPVPYSGLVLSKTLQNRSSWDWHPLKGPRPKADVGVSCWDPQVCWDPRASENKTKQLLTF